MRDHTSLLAWQESRRVATWVFRFSSRRWTPPAAALFSQLQRASLSVPLNICEGYTWRPGKRWVHHLRIAYGSAVETRECLRMLRDLGVAPEATIAPAIRATERVEGLLWGLIRRP